MRQEILQRRQEEHIAEVPTPAVTGGIFSGEATSRRQFFKLAGIGIGAAVIISSCGDDDPVDSGDGVDLGSGDTGILNYAYALEQLEAAFYIKVTDSFYSGASDAEKRILEDIRDHEIAHRDFFKAALGSSAIPGLEVDFSAVNFSDRASVLGTAKTFEDLGVAAYNGAGKLLTSATNLLIAGKIVSVEARHAAAIRDLLMPMTASFAGDDVVTAAGGLDRAMEPAAVLAAADPFIVTKVTANNLPTS